MRARLCAELQNILYIDTFENDALCVFRGSFSYPLRGNSITEGSEPVGSLLSGKLRPYIVGIAAGISILRSIAGELWRFEWFSGSFSSPKGVSAKPRGRSQTGVCSAAGGGPI